MEVLAVYLIGAVLALSGVRFGVPATLKAIHARQYAACLRSIDRLELELGMRQQPYVLAKAANYTQGISATRWADALDAVAARRPAIVAPVSRHGVVRHIMTGAPAAANPEPQKAWPKCARGYPCGGSCVKRCLFSPQDFPKASRQSRAGKSSK